jgi:peptidoglycan hydrolase-like protein with peptidoglycan-binding domain
VIHYSEQFPDGKLDLVPADGSDSPSISYTQEGDFLFNLAFSPKEGSLATLALDREAGSYVASLWRLEEDRLEKSHEIGAFGAETVSFSPDGRLLAGGSGDEGILLWDAQSGELLHTVPDWYEALYEPVTFSPDGRWMARPGGHVPLITIYQGGEQSPARTLSLQSPQLVGSDVFELQHQLTSLGYLQSELANGFFDEPTESALRRFQTESGLTANGVADSATATRLADVYTAAVEPLRETSAAALQAPAPTPGTPVGPAQTAPPQPTIAPPTVPPATVAPPAVRTFLPTEQDIDDIASIWDWYNLSDGLDLPAPGTREFSITLTPDRQFIWPFYWCAANQVALTENLEALSVEFLIDGEPVPWDQVLSYEEETGGWSCRYWALLLRDWQRGSDTTLTVQYAFDWDINDGESSYPAGEYAYELEVLVGD